MQLVGDLAHQLVVELGNVLGQVVGALALGLEGLVAVRTLPSLHVKSKSSISDPLDSIDAPTHHKGGREWSWYMFNIYLSS